MAEKKNKATHAADEKAVSGTTSAEGDAGEMTNVRHQQGLDAVITELNQLAEADEDAQRGFKIGDLVEHATKKYKLRVADMTKKVRLSRQRMSECRVTAVAFKGEIRKKDVPFHIFTIAARAARTFQMTPKDALEKVSEKKFESTRQASRFFAEMQRAKDNDQALNDGTMLVAKHGDLLDRCHHDDFRNVVARLPIESVNLAIADPSYDGKRKSTTSATRRAIDGNTEADAQADVEDLLTLLADKMAKGGAVALFRPGAALDPAWLANAIESSGWECAWALTWDKKKVKPGRTDAPYGIGSERVLILCRKGEKLVAHDESSRDDVLDFKPIQPHRADSDQHQQHEKPLDIMKRLIGKHTYEGGLVIEPFGGSGPASQAAVELNRHWLYCETAKENLNAGAALIAAVVQAQQKTAG